jgi:hypothetical protein
MKRFCVFVLLLSLTFLVYAEKIATLKEVIKPDGMAICKDRILVTEKAIIYMYSLKDLRYIKKIGKGGEGPQEFKVNPFGQPLLIYPADDKFMVNSYNRLSYFTHDGEFIKEKNIKPFWYYQPIGNQFVALGFVENEQHQHVFGVILCDENLEKIKTLYISDINMGFSGKYMFPISSIAFQVYKNKIYISRGDEFTIDIFDRKGNKIKRIKHPYQPIKLTEDYEKKTIGSFSKPGYQMFGPFMKSRAKFKSHFPVIQDMYVKNDRIYVITYKMKNDKTECIVLDLQGNELKRVFISFPMIYGFDFKLPFYFHNHSYYNLVENEEEEVWEIHKQDIE